MADLSGMSDEDLMSAYQAAQKSDVSKMSDHDLLNAYSVAKIQGGQMPVTDYGQPVGPEFDNYIANSGIGRVLDAVGHGAKQGWGTEEIVSPDTADLLRKAGVFPDAAKPQNDIIRGFNEAMLRPAAAGLDMAIRAGGQFLRGTGAAISGLQAGIAQTGEELGAPQLGRDVAGMVEAFPQEGMGLQGVLPKTHVPFSLDVARAEGVLGTEAEWKGIDHPTEDFPAGTVTHFPAPVEHTLGEAPQPYEATLSPDVQQMVQEATPPKDIHEAARRVAPSVFEEFDSLNEGKEALRSQIAMGQESLRQAAEAQAPHAAEIADLEERLQDTTPRLAKKYQARLDEMIPARDAFLNDEFTMSALTRDTPEIGALRQQLQELDYRQRDLAPDVTAAYREAAKQFPEAPVEEPVHQPVPAQETPANPVQATEPPKAEPVAATPEPRPVAPVPIAAAAGTAPLNIAADVSKKLVAAGRPLEEADAAGTVQEALWRTRADAFQGAKGTAEEMYAREAPDIRAGRVREREREMAQKKGRTLEQPAYHGSPHIFDKFTLSHIGTGEGVQAYGHGLYFAGNKAVAKYYRETLASTKIIKNGKEFADRELDSNIAKAVRDASPTLSASKTDEIAINVAQRLRTSGLSDIKDAVRDSNLNDAVRSGWEAAIKHAEEYRIEKPEGRLYHVDIPDNHEYLDWDKPLSQQSPQIQNIIREIAPASLKQYEAAGAWDSWTGKRLYQALENTKGGPAEASRALNEAGIPGIRYLQGASRAAGEGDHNYVVFDDSRINIRDYEQQARGKIRLTDDGHAVITLFKDANASTFLHETGHDWLERMVRDAADPAAPEQMRTDAATVRSYLGNDGGDLTTRQHEKFARSFERYFMEGHAPSRPLASVFEKFRNWLTTIYQTVDRLRAPITDDIRDVFDRLLTSTPERAVIAKEAEQQAFADRMMAGLDREVAPTKIAAKVTEDLADLHEADAQTTPPEEASSTADQMRHEVDATAKAHAPEVADALTRADEPPATTESGATGVGGNAAAPAGAAGGHANSGEPGQAGGAAKPGAVNAGGSGAAAEGAAGAESGAAGATPYTRVPKEPERLINFLRRSTPDGKPGGLRDSTGDISAIIGGTKGRPGLINNKTGQGLDDAALRAWEAGYFPGMDQRPSINDLLDAIRDDHSGNPRYSMHDQDAANAYDQANAQNSEIDQLADRHGIDPTGLTREQFFDKIADKLSLDELEHEIRNASDTGFAEMDAAIRDVGEPPGYDTARSAEDLENEARQQDASRSAQQGADRGTGPGHAGTSPGNGKVGGEQGGSGAGAASGAGAQAEPKLPPLDVKTEPADFRTKADREIEKAANIRLDKINTTADMNDALRDLAKQNGDFMDARYGTAAYQTQLDIRNTRTLLRVATSDVMEAAGRAASGDLEAIADFARKQQRAAMVFSHLSTLSADWAHAGHELNRVMPEWDKAMNIAQQIQDTTGRTLFQLQQQAAAMLSMPTAEQAGKLAGDAQMSRWQKVRGGIISYFINNLISGPLTHMAYSVGNETTALYRAVPETLVQATIGAMRGTPDRVYFGEAGAQLYGMASGVADGIGPAMKALKTGIANLPGQPEAFGFRPQSLPGKVGYVLETPSRVVSAIHTLFYSMSYAQEIARLAFRDAAARGLRGSEFDAEVARLRSSPTPEMMEGADSVATRGVLMKRPEFGSAQYHLAQIVNNNIAAKLVMPFMQIGMNILEEGIVQRTPLSLLTSEARAELLGARGGAARDLRIGKIATGSMLGGAAVGLAASGYMTGSGPVDPNQRRVLEDSGWKAYSIKVGDTYVPFRKYLGFLGPLVAGAADVYEVGHALHGEDLTKATAALAFGFSEVVADETWMTGLSSFIEAARNWDTKGEQYIRNLATSFIPFSVGLSQTARMVDPYQRQARTLIDAARNKIPIVSEELQPQIGIWGQPIASHTMLSPGTDTHDPVDARLRALGLGVTPVPRKVTGIPLTDPQYANLQRTAGMLAHTRLSAMVQAPGFAQLPAGIQTKAIQETITRSREAARALTKMQNPAIPQQAAQNKQNLRVNGKPGQTGY